MEEAAPSLASLGSLPDDLLVFILGGLTLQERHNSAVLVCWRWLHLANSAPQLLRVVSAAFRGGDERAAARLDSFCAWLLAHAAQHVQRLSINVDPVKSSAPAGTSEHLAVSLAATLVGCGMAGGLTALRLEKPILRPLVWLHGLHTLRRLVVIEEDMPLSWDPPASALPALEELALEGSPLVLHPRARLPPSLTKLHLCYIETDRLPPQVAALTRLHTLSLESATWVSSGYDGLTRLPSLRRLELLDCDYWPSCLSRLTGLEALALNDNTPHLADDEQGEVVRPAFPRLTRLTFLALSNAPCMRAPPPELAGLTRLHSFCWLGGRGPLPSGPWLSSLQRLAAGACSIADSASALAAATQLEFLGVKCYDFEDKHLFGRSLNAALRAPALRRLFCRASKEAICSNVQTLLHAQLRHPSVFLNPSVFSGSVMNFCDWNDFLACCGYDALAATSLDAFLAGNP